MASSSNRGACGYDAPSHVSYNITPDGQVIPASINLADKSISFDPEPANVWTVPKPQFPPKLIRVHGAELKALLREPDINRLRAYLTANYPLLESANDIRSKLQKIVETYAPPDAPIISNMDIPVMLKWLEDILDSYQTKFALFDISFQSLEKSNLLEGTTLRLKIDNSRKKVAELLKAYQHRLNDAEENVWNLSGILEENNQLIKVYEQRLSRMYDQMIALKERPGRQVGETPDESKFFKELEKHLDHDYHLNSTFKEELALEKKTKHSLLQEICRLKEQRVLDEQQKQNEIAEILKDQEMEEGLRKELINKIKTLTPNADDVQQAVNDWMKEIRTVMSQNEAQILQLRERFKTVEDELAREKLQHEETNQQYNQLLDIILELDAEINEKLEIFEAKQKEVERLDQSIEAMDSRPRTPSISPTRYFDAKSSFGSFIQSPETSARSTVESPDNAFPQSIVKSPFLSPELRGPSTSGGLFHSTPKSDINSPEELLSSSGSLSLSFDKSPEKFRQESPYLEAAYFDTGSPTSMHSTPRSDIASYSPRPPSPFYMPSPITQSFGKSEAAIPIPGTVAIPGPSRYAPRTRGFDPSTETKVHNRFDVGKSFNMRTVCETSTPYQQVTRVASSIPAHGHTGRMINHPLNIQHSAELTPRQYKTPFISKTRFGYTDPTARVFNIPPENHIHIPTPFDKAAPSGQQGISPDVETYGVPPAVTPTSTRRYGLFTPKGIFRKKHYNIRTLYDPEFYESFDLPWSPQYLPQDSRSPYSRSPVSPWSPLSDKSISWEELSGSPYDGNVMDRTYQASPLMKKSFYAARRDLDRTFDASRVPIDRTLVATPLPMDRTFDASTPHALNRTFVEPQVPINRTFDKSSPYVLNRTFEASPHVMNQTFEASPLYAMNRTYDAYSPLSMNRTYEASPGIRNQTFSTSPAYAMGRTFNKSLSPSFGRTFHRSPSPKTVTFAPGTIFNVTHPSEMNRTYENIPMQMLPSTAVTFNRSPSPVLNQTFGKSWSDPYCCTIS